MQIPALFGPYGSGALAHVDRFTVYGANACWFHGFDAAAFEAWMYKLKPANAADVGGLLDAAKYQANVDAQK